jgi:hypothetical protein
LSICPIGQAWRSPAESIRFTVSRRANMASL